MARSLKRRLTATVIAIFIASWLVSALVTTLAARVVLLREVDRILEGVLLTAETVGKSLTGDLQPLQEAFSENMVPLEGAGKIGTGTKANPTLVRLQESPQIGPLGTPSLNIWAGSIQLLIGEDTPVFARPSPEKPMGRAFNQTVDGRVWRVIYRYSGDTDIWYAAGVSRQQAQLDGSRLLLQMLLPLAVIIPLTVLALYYGIARSMHPLRRLARDIEQRREQSSLQPLPPGDAPSEMVPVVDSLNHLLERLADTLENEKRFTANAAHELQTPLAAISTEVQLCQRLLTDQESRGMMERIRARVERASHSVRQLLVLARLDPQAALAMEELNLSELVQEVVSELGHIASERGLELTLDVDESQRLAANREAFLILLRNLLSNAFRYTPQSGAVRIASRTGTLIVENDSMPIADPGRLADRFYRGSGDTGDGSGPGTGLGLSIVKRICELHGFRLTMNYLAEDGRFQVSLALSH